MVNTTVTNTLLDEKMCKAINQIRHKKKQPSHIEGIYDYMIKVNVLLDTPLETLEEKIKTLEMESKIVNKKFNDVDSFYISQKGFSEVILRTPEPYIQSTLETPLTLATPNLNQPFKFSS